jgi:DNA-binding LacI/PurR family transcriptional regulator
MKYENLDIRQLIDARGIRYRDIAHACGVNSVTISRWFSVPLSPEKRELILRVIDDISLKNP